MTPQLLCNPKNADCADGNGHDFGNGERVAPLSVIFLDREIRETCVKCGCLLLLPPDERRTYPPEERESYDAAPPDGPFRDD